MHIPLQIGDSRKTSQEPQWPSQNSSDWSLVLSSKVWDWKLDDNFHDNTTPDNFSDYYSSEDEEEQFPDIEECDSPIATMPDQQDPYALRRQDSEARNRLFPHPLSHQERAESASRRRALSQRSRSDLGDPHQPQDRAVEHSALSRGLYASGTSVNGDHTNHGPEWQRSAQCPSDAGSRKSHVLRPSRGDIDDNVSTSSVIDPNLRAEFEGKWMLNVTMHFRDNSAREKFIITYAEEPNLWRRVTVSCDYRNAAPDSLEDDLRTLHYQRDKSIRIYEAIRESLADVQFFETVTHLTLSTQDKLLHVNVTEDVNEIIQYPEISSIGHLIQDRCPVFDENDVKFSSHLSGFVYKVSVRGIDCVKKEIPSPDTIEEFLYEVNALFALRNTRHIIPLLGVIVGKPPASTAPDNHHDSAPGLPLIKGLLISFASTGALADLLSDATPLIPWGRRHKWAIQILRGLAAIHAAGFVQGDFTLSNIVIDQADDANIIDINRRGCPMGWEPPELQGLIRSGQRVGMYIGVKTDLWQLGMVLWALAMHNAEPERETEELDFEDDYGEESDGEGVGRVASGVSEMYKTVVSCCLEKEPEKRKEARELLDMLEREGGGTRHTYNTSSFYSTSNSRLPSMQHPFTPNTTATTTDVSSDHYGFPNQHHRHNHHPPSRTPASTCDGGPPTGYHPPLHQDSGFHEESDSALFGLPPDSLWSGAGQAIAASLSPYDPVGNELIGLGAAHEEKEMYDAELVIDLEPKF